MAISEYDEVIINLNILSSIDPNKKLITKEIYLNVEVPHIILPEFIKRWYRGDDRSETIKKIDNIIIKALRLLNNYPEIEEYLINSIKGIKNLKETYSQDVQTKARLDIIIDKINRVINNDIKSRTSSNSDIEDKETFE